MNTYGATHATPEPEPFIFTRFEDERDRADREHEARIREQVRADQERHARFQAEAALEATLERIRQLEADQSLGD